jgi:alpha-L-rhamnosidase
VSTGTAAWECKRLGGYGFVRPQLTNAFIVCGAKVIIDGRAFDWGFERGDGDGWVAAKTLGHAVPNLPVAERRLEWGLRPAILPAMIEEPRRVGAVRHVEQVTSDDTRPLRIEEANHRADEAPAWQRLLKDPSPLTIPPHTRRRVIVDFDEYYCGYPELITTGGRGASVRLMFAEALFEQPEGKTKGNRDAVDGKFFVGVGDTFLPDGGPRCTFETLWWEAGRYMEVLVQTGAEPLTIESLLIRETRYPLDFAVDFESSDPRLAEVIPVALRTLRMCAHETYMDCPYYEQLMYVGDTRLEVLTTYVASPDERLPRKAIELFDLSRDPSGLTQARYPTRVSQTIPPFSLFWVGMVHDYAMWRDDAAFVRARLPGVRAVLDAYRAHTNRDGLVGHIDGWNTVDWVKAWPHGMPPGAHGGANATINFQTAMMLRLAAELEEQAGEPELGARNRKTADRVAAAANAAFWDESRGLYGEDAAHARFSEHAQCLALIGGSVPVDRRARVAQGLLNDPDLDRTTIYYSHYLFEACRLLGRIDRVFDRMGLWFGLRAGGFRTTPEMPEPSRSDCHAWGAHPVFHYFASVLGVRPAAAGFKRVRIEPQLGPLTWAKGTLVHPAGALTVEVKLTDGRLSGSVELPPSVSGTLAHGGQERELRPGSTRL